MGYTSTGYFSEIGIINLASDIIIIIIVIVIIADLHNIL